MISVICIFIAFSGSQMETAADLFIKKSVLHRCKDIRIYADGKFTEVSCTLICIHKGDDSVGIVSCCLDNLAVFDFEFYVFVSETLLLREGVVADGAIH